MPTGYNLITVDALAPETMATALARCFGVAAADVGVAEADADPGSRNWAAPVLCTYEAVSGDLARSLDLYAQDRVADRPPESEVAARFARAAGTTVLFPAEEAYPSAYWAATPQGLVTRVRLELSDDEPPLYTVGSAEAPVPQLPRAVVERFAEIVREQRPPTPVAEAFKASAAPLWPDDGPHPSPEGHLTVWERVVLQMESGWAPSGWYPADLYRERLEARDELARIGDRLPPEVRRLLDAAVEELDLRFVRATQADPSGSLVEELTGRPPGRDRLGRWWYRRPDPVPWDPV
ncbi:hypothetical protein Snoj_63900 [Streptomyces nojiriensis]|uniref:Uncharacterized protein n=1 Tax=Streptomyces nojiriensis TaxID=66374 RepID=A0ABQ3SWK4_9ACTN|nr:hypothetical protein [Streptomyces nojiriensis]QTI45998.1 hypothetical protein JYK04_03808 [Streptomyces nojiriensis]GGR88883.1 hypothetical protein GCM10010205_16670 [Streptomyces nojiriensis]GHI72472.1 hypothetical protein Snoj_63900 [Streptomyces nojiriensis]